MGGLTGGDLTVTQGGATLMSSSLDQNIVNSYFSFPASHNVPLQVNIKFNNVIAISNQLTCNGNGPPGAYTIQECSWAKNEISYPTISGYHPMILHFKGSGTPSTDGVEIRATWEQ